MEKVKKILRFGMRLEKQGRLFMSTYKDRVKSDRKKNCSRNWLRWNENILAPRGKI